ncbi:ExeA family protein [Parvularcula maris]|uniref:AAA family ATPase n=1 Tax=Parvularcula maris TaxID=2965077 RepID=A0A9X2RIF1_9PROT|nr:AAA family ATPase [Parvularcula maris]MCQ8183827.1 AAA family ATPase [Parvularcula maris]
MYEKHFGLKKKPFASHPEPDMLFWSDGHKMARTMLAYGLTSGNGVVVITGEIGSGKTTLLHDLARRHKDGNRFGALTGDIGYNGDVAAWILYGFGIEAKGSQPSQSLSQLDKFLAQNRNAGRKAVLFIDEAQLLEAKLLERIRVLAERQSGGHPVLQIVLFGQPELGALLNMPQLAQFRQRVVSHYHLRAFTRAETSDYISSRLAAAGGSGDLFTAEAVDRIHDMASGIPRQINILADTSLVYAFAASANGVDEDTVKRVLKDREQHGILKVDPPSGL